MKTENKKNIFEKLKINCLFMLILSPLLSYAQKIQNVAITSIVEHPSLNQIRDGVKDELSSQGYIIDKDLKIQYKSSQGSSANAAQIAKQFVANKPDVIVAISTPSAQSLAFSTKIIPIVFAGISDPITAKLIKEWKPTKTNITGVSDFTDIDQQIDFIKKIIPNVKSIGYIYSSGEINSTILLKRLKEKLEKENIKIIAVPAQKTSDIQTAAKSLKNKKVDLIYTTTDNNVVSAYESLVKFSNENKIPLLASFPDAIEKGAVAALGMNYYDVGRQVGKIVIRILKGENPGEISPETGNITKLVINKKAAKLQSITFSEEILKTAEKIIE